MCDWSRKRRLGRSLGLVDFYRELPALWNVRHKDHRNKQILQLGYEQFERKMRETMPEITSDHI